MPHIINSISTTGSNMSDSVKSKREAKRSHKKILAKTRRTLRVKTVRTLERKKNEVE